MFLCPTGAVPVHIQKKRIETLHRFTFSCHLPFLISHKPHLLSTSWRSTEWFSSGFRFLCYLRDLFSFFFFFHCLPPPPAQPSNGGNNRSRRPLWPHTILNSDDLHASQSLPRCNCDLSLLTTCQGWPTQNLDCNDPSLRKSNIA